MPPHNDIVAQKMYGALIDVAASTPPIIGPRKYPVPQEMLWRPDTKPRFEGGARSMRAVFKPL